MTAYFVFQTDKLHRQVRVLEAIDLEQGDGHVQYRMKAKRGAGRSQRYGHKQHADPNSIMMSIFIFLESHLCRVNVRFSIPHALYVASEFQFTKEIWLV